MYPPFHYYVLSTAISPMLLLQSLRQMHVVELDRDLVARLHKSFDPAKPEDYLASFKIRKAS